MEITPENVPSTTLYKLMTGAILPRPIAWVSTISAAGIHNLAPYSFFNAVCSNPPTLLFSAGIRQADGQPKDSLKNVREIGEFVVNIVTESTADAMNQTATELPIEVDEFDFADLTPAPSKAVRPARVAESPIHFECKVTQIVDISDQPGGGSIVIGQIVHIHVDDAVMLGDDKINLEALKPIGRLAGASYTKISDTFDLIRRPTQIQP